MKKPELLSPAGDMKKLKMAVAYGADAVYLAGKRYGLRAGAGNFDADEMRDAIKYCHENKTAVYITCNTMPRNDELDGLPEYLQMLEEYGADAIIAGDLGVLSLIRRHTGLPVHISTQMGIVNYEAARMLHELGASRVVLARELSLDEVAGIRAKTPNELELEVFVHGAMCVSFSGRCLLSNHMAGRDSNRGECAQPCRWKYSLMEEKRPGEYFPVFEDSDGTYIMNSKDLCMIEHIPRLVEAGAHSLKIEGRMKSEYYAAVITNAYRLAIDAAAAGQSFDPELLDEVLKVKQRGYYTGFYFGNPADAYFYESASSGGWEVAAVVTGHEDGLAVLTQKNRVIDGDELELLSPGKKPVKIIAGGMVDENGGNIDIARHPEMIFKMRLDAPVNAILRKKTKGIV